MSVNIKSVSPLLGKLLSRALSWLDATLAALGDGVRQGVARGYTM